jgi:hypothetical protein
MNVFEQIAADKAARDVVVVALDPPLGDFTQASMADLWGRARDLLGLHPDLCPGFSYSRLVDLRPVADRVRVDCVMLGLVVLSDRVCGYCSASDEVSGDEGGYMIPLDHMRLSALDYYAELDRVDRLLGRHHS